MGDSPDIFGDEPLLQEAPPTAADLEAAAKTVGVRFLGHVIVAGDRWGQVT